MKDLVVELENDLISLTVNPAVSSSKWKIAQDWWAPVSVHTSSLVIKVSLAEFNARKSWLRLNWVNEGLTVEIQPEVPGALKQFENEMKDFESRLYAKAPTQSEISSYLASVNHKRTPTTHQVMNVLSMCAMKNGANFSVPGAGKTSTQYLVWEKLKSESLVEKMLVICPKSSFEAWKTEPAEVFNFSVGVEVFDTTYVPWGLDVLIVNYEQIERPKKQKQLISWISSSPTLLVIDEAHRIKGGTNSVRWRAASMLSKASVRTDLLTGTPMPQGLEDIRNLLEVAWRNLPKGYLTENKLRQIKPWSVFVRTTKKQLGLPPVKIEKVKIPMGNIQSQIYSALGKNYAGTLAIKAHDQKTLARKGRAIFTLLAAATNPGLIVKNVNQDAYLDLKWPPKELSHDADLTDALASYAKHEVPAKYLWVARFIESSVKQGRKVLLWSTFVGNLVAQEKLLRKFNPAVVHGGVQGDNRDSQIKKFRTDPTCWVLISNPQTLGEGVSLHHECHDAVFMDRSFNAGQYLQALDRIHRLGLPKDQETRVFILEADNTIDDKVDVRLKAKIEALSELLDDEGLVSSSLPDEDVLSALDVLGLDNADLDSVLSHLKDL